MPPTLVLEDAARDVSVLHYLVTVLQCSWVLEREGQDPRTAMRVSWFAITLPDF